MEFHIYVVGCALLLGLAPLGFFQLKALHRIERKLDEIANKSQDDTLCSVTKHANEQRQDDSGER